MIASGLIVWFVFVPPYFHFAPLIYGERVGFFMYLVAATLTIAFAHSCRVVLRRSFAIGPLNPGSGAYWTDQYGSIHFHPNLWPRRPLGFRSAVTSYWREMERLAARLARMFALALDVPEDFFADKIDRHVSTMRLNFYPAQAVPPLPGQIRAGAHSDYGGFTILRTEAAPGGLQVIRRGGSWIDVPNIENGFVVNIGDMLMRWTNDRWVSTVHRVVNPPEAVRANATHMSAAFFQVPNYDAEVRCLESCTGPGGTPPRLLVRIGVPRSSRRAAYVRRFPPSARPPWLVEHKRRTHTV